jgi:hypothetical protein
MQLTHACVALMVANLFGCAIDATEGRETGSPDGTPALADSAQPEEVASTSKPLTSSTDVGIIESAFGCPASATEEVHIHMDNQDGQNISNVTGWVGATNVDRNGNTNFYFCRVPGEQFANASGQFAVLSLGTSCPAGSVEFRRGFDNEDSRTKNSHYGDIGRNISASNTHLIFCAFSNNTSGQPLPPLGIDYGVFSSQVGTDHGTVLTDDENSRNINSFEIWGRKSQTSPFPSIVDNYTQYGARDTVLRTAKVAG